MRVLIAVLAFVLFTSAASANQALSDLEDMAMRLLDHGPFVLEIDRETCSRWNCEAQLGETEVWAANGTIHLEPTTASDLNLYMLGCLSALTSLHGAMSDDVGVQLLRRNFEKAQRVNKSRETVAPVTLDIHLANQRPLLACSFFDAGHR